MSIQLTGHLTLVSTTIEEYNSWLTLLNSHPNASNIIENIESLTITFDLLF